MIEDIFNNSKPKNKIYTSKIIIDTREKNSLVPVYLIKEKIPYQKEKLEIGDYLISVLIIERKTLNDFLSSFYSKRLMNQLINLTKYPRKILILEGNINDLDQDKIKKIKGLILSISVSYQILLYIIK
jgi:ERCC4-type nuclease